MPFYTNLDLEVLQSLQGYVSSSSPFMSKSLLQYSMFRSPFSVLVLVLSIGLAQEADMEPCEHDKDKRGEDEVMVLYSHDKQKRDEDDVMVLYDHDKQKRGEDDVMLLYDHDHRSFDADFADK